MDILEELRVLLEELEGKDKITANQTERLFNIHNQIFIHSREHGRSCGSCRSRVYNRMKTYYKNATTSTN
jgi:hypothetical protein